MTVARAYDDFGSLLRMSCLSTNSKQRQRNAMADHLWVRMSVHSRAQWDWKETRFGLERGTFPDRSTLPSHDGEERRRVYEHLRVQVCASSSALRTKNQRRRNSISRTCFG